MEDGNFVMAKRKILEEGAAEPAISGPSAESASEESSSDDDTNMLDVEFEWFDPQPQFDFHGIKTLLRQLFDADAQLFDLSALTDLILSQPLLGSTVKVEGNETDPYAFLTVLSLYEHRDVPVIADLTRYICDRSRSGHEIKDVESLVQSPEQSRVGLILTERLINVPSEVVPPMYKMLREEIAWALEEKEPYSFTHYLMLSKTYQELASALDEEDDSTRKHKKSKKTVGKRSSAAFYFHPEDEVLHKHAKSFGDFQYRSEAGQSDSKRVFQELGIKPQGHMTLIEASRLEGAVKEMLEYFGQA